MEKHIWKIVDATGYPLTEDDTYDFATKREATKFLSQKKSSFYYGDTYHGCKVRKF